MGFFSFATGRPRACAQPRSQRSSVLAGALLAAASTTAHAQQPWVEGSWGISYDWSCDASGATTPHNPVHLMNAALLAHGPYRGSVVLWVREVNLNTNPGTYSSETVLWQPETPTRLIHIPSVHSPFTSDVPGATVAQDDEGQIVLAGAGAVGSTYKESRRFLPGALTVPVM